VGTALARALAAVACLAASASAAAPVTAIDDRGVAVSLERPAARIVAISPHLAELAHAAGAGKRLLAVVRGSDFPAEVSALPIVGDAFGLDHERLIALRPDLVLAWGSGNRPADLDRLARGGVALYVAEPRRLADVARHLRAIGILAGSAATAEAAAAHFEQQIRRLREESAGQMPLSAFVEIWPQPLFTVGPQHLISEALGLCGARNVLEAYPLLSGPVPMEEVVLAAPEVIVSLSGFPQSTMLARWAGLRSLRAPGAIVSIDPDLLTRATPRMLRGVELLCAALSPLRQTFTH
jgi:iron complex transport system substrate-binding protein